MLKKRFAEKYPACKCKPDGYKNTAIRRMRPLIFSVDCICGKGDQARCDQFVFCDMEGGVTGIYLIEKKTGNVRISKVREQLQRCADFISEQMGACKKFAFEPVLVSQRNPLSREELNKYKVSLRGQKKTIKHVSTDAPLHKIEG